jgi:hypothetical protein
MQAHASSMRWNIAQGERGIVPRRIGRNHNSRHRQERRVRRAPSSPCWVRRRTAVLLQDFARWCALQVVDLWDAPDVVSGISHDRRRDPASWMRRMRRRRRRGRRMRRMRAAAWAASRSAREAARVARSAREAARVARSARVASRCEVGVDRCGEVGAGGETSATVRGSTEQSGGVSHE